jgi:hypothetical protein
MPFLPFLCHSFGELEECLWVTTVSRIAGLQRLGRCSFAMGMGGRGVGTLTGAAARFRTGACLFHFPSLSQRGLIDILKAKPLSLVFVKGLGEKKKKEPS